MKKLNWDKELKKVQRRGLYNPKVRVFSIIAVAVLTLGIGLTFSAFSYSSGDYSAFNSKVNKKVIINVTATNGKVSTSSATVDYGKQATFTVTPNDGYVYDSISCTDGQTAVYDIAKQQVVLTPIRGTTCTVTFKETLKHKIMASNTLKTQTPDFTKGEPLKTGETTETGSGLFQMDDNDGTSYYFRGAIENNYVSFANMVWRIVRINGDETIRLISSDHIGSSVFNLQDTYEIKNVGYTFDNDHVCTKANPCTSNTGTSSEIKKYLEEWYGTNLSTYDSSIALGSYCNDTTINTNSTTISYAYSSRLTSSTPSLKCEDTKQTYGGLYKLKIGLLSADEHILAGISTKRNQTELHTSENNYLYRYDGKSTLWWTMTPKSSGTTSTSTGIAVASVSSYDSYYPRYSAKVSPVINLNKNILYKSGNGTKDNPYVVSS